MTIRLIPRAFRRADAFNVNAAEARPGEVWTARYTGSDPVHGEHFESYTAGTVRILGDECPVVEYRGQKTLGEWTLDAPRGAWWLASYLDAFTNDRRLDRGDTAPDMTGSAGTGDLLASLPDRAWVTVEWRERHPVYAGLRNVTVGYTYAHDERDGEVGRDVGGDWIAFTNVTAVICHSHAERTPR